MLVSEQFPQRRIIELLARGTAFFESCWQQIDQDVGIFGELEPEFYNMSKMPRSSPAIEYIIRPHTQCLCTLAVIATSAHGKQLLAEKIDETSLIKKFEDGLRFLVQSHVLGDRDITQFPGRKRWGQNWRSALWTSQMALTTVLMAPRLPSQLLEQIYTVLAFEADRFIDIIPPDGHNPDCRLEENAIDTTVLSWALHLMPEHEHAGQWQQALRLWALNIATVANDRFDFRQYRETSIADCIETTTLFDDFTALNHGFFSPEVLQYHRWVVFSMLAAQLSGQNVPQELLLKNHQKTYDVLLQFCLPTGLFYTPGATDAPLLCYSPFALCWGLRRGEPTSVRLTERMLNGLEQNGQDDSSCTPFVTGLLPGKGGWNLYWQSFVAFDLALLIVTPDSPLKTTTPTKTVGIEVPLGLKNYYRYAQICMRRSTKSTASVSWNTLSNHPIVGYVNHSLPFHTLAIEHNLLQAPLISESRMLTRVCFHHDKITRDGFDCWATLSYHSVDSAEVFISRQVRIRTLAEDGLFIFDSAVAHKPLTLKKQLFWQLHIVNDYPTAERLCVQSGSLEQQVKAIPTVQTTTHLPMNWATINEYLLYQVFWGETNGMCYQRNFKPNRPAYWNNCSVDMLGVQLPEKKYAAGEKVFQKGLFIGTGKNPRPFKVSKEHGKFFKGLVVIDGKTTYSFE